MNLSEFVSVVTILGLSTSVHSNSSFSSLLTAVDVANGRCYEPGVPIDVPIGRDCGGSNLDGCRGNAACSSCTGGKCICKDGFKPDGDMCVGNVIIGGTCDPILPEQCVDFHKSISTCESNLCQCKPEYHRSQNWMRCLKLAKNLHNDLCEEHIQCQEGKPGVESECKENPNNVNEKQCFCKPESVNADDVCYKIPEFIGGPCSVQAQCIRLQGICSPNGVCNCSDNFVEKSDHKKCLERRQKVGDDQDCEEDDQCIDNATCQPRETSPNRVCKCANGYVASSNGAVCFKYAEFVGDPCLPGANIPNQCVNLENTVCDTDSEKCDCRDARFVKSSTNRSCVEILDSLDSDCTEDIQCNIQNSICNKTEKTCGCNRETNFVKIPNNDKSCFGIINEVNLPCNADVQCTEGLGDMSECSGGGGGSGGTCLCKARYQDYNRQCYVPVQLGGICNRAEECFVGVNSWTLCLKSNTSEYRRCACRPDAQVYEGKCYINKRLGDACESNPECAVHISGGQSHCDSVTKKCACKQGYREDPTKLLCSAGCALTYHYVSILTCILVLFSTRFFK